jgi:uncharacterized protein YrrD
MKMTREILGLPIVSISTGEEIGKVKNILFNGEKGGIDFIVVETGNQIFSAKVIPTDRVLGIGANALTIENESTITDINRLPGAVELVEKDIRVKGTKVLTKKGRLVGEIGDVCVDEENCCKITALEHINGVSGEKPLLIRRDSVITFGKNLTIVEENFESSLVDSVSRISTRPAPAEPSFDSSIYENKVEEETPSLNLDNNETYEPADAEQEAAVSSFTEVPSFTEYEKPEEPDPAALFEQRQKQYLIGRRVTKTITGMNGEVIAREGAVINEEIIDLAKKNNRLVELVMNNEA